MIFRLLVVAAAATGIGVQILLPPVVGLANNADFGKVLDWFHINTNPDDEYKYIQTRFKFDDSRSYDPVVYTSAVVPVRAAIVLDRIFAPGDQWLDLRWIGAVQGSILLCGLFLLLRRADAWPWSRRLALAAAALLIVTDAMYATKLNSFYLDAAALVFFWITIALGLRLAHRPSLAAAVGYAAAAAAVVSTKDQHCVLALPLAALAAYTLRRKAALAAVSTAVIGVAGWLTWRHKPEDHANNAFYAVVFHRILPRSGDVSRDLRELGLDESYRPLIGKSPFDPDSRMTEPGFQTALSARRSFARLLLFYLRQPRHFFNGLMHSLDEAGRQRPLLGNYSRDTGVAAFTEARTFSFWSDAKRAVFFEHGLRYLAYFIAISLALIVVSTRRRGFAAALTLVVCAGIELGVAALGEALETTRHLFIFNALCDLIVLFAVMQLLAPRGERLA